MAFETSSDQPGAQALDHEKTEDPASDEIPEHLLVTVQDPGNSYFFDAAFLFPDGRSLANEVNDPFANLDEPDQAAAGYWKGDTSPADTAVPDKLLSCQCQTSVRLYLAEMEQNIKDHIDRSLRENVKQWVKEEISSWFSEAWYGK